MDFEHGFKMNNAGAPHIAVRIHLKIVCSLLAHFNPNIPLELLAIKNHFSFVSFGQLFALTVLIKIHLQMLLRPDSWMDGVR